MVKDGTTIIIGGLRRKEDMQNVEEVPFFGKIPLIGRLFRSETTTKVQAELIVFITPHIISGEQMVKGDEHELREPAAPYRDYE